MVTSAESATLGSMFHPQGPTLFELAKQAWSSTERGYDLLAPKFNYTPFCTPEEVIERTLQQALGPTDIDGALDICCGTGAAMRLLKARCRSRLVGVDFSPGMLEVAKQLVGEAAGTPQLEFQCGDVLEMNFKEEFDLAVCFGALGHILPADQDRFVERIYAALKPNGKFAFVTCECPSRLSLRYWLARSFNGAMHVRNWLHAPPFVMFYLKFLLADALRLLQRHGFEVEVTDAGFERPYDALKVVIAKRRARLDEK